MRRFALVVGLVFSLVLPVRSVEATYAYSPAESMFYTMWNFMEWVLGGYGALPWRYAGPASSWYGPYSAVNSPYPGSWSNRGYMEPQLGPGLNPQVLDGAWLATTGEHWLIHGQRFVFVSAGGYRFDGRLRREGPFLHVQLPRGESEFEYRLVGDVLVLRDVDGGVVTLRRRWYPSWNW